MKCLGLDVGSTSIKGAVLDVERNEVGRPVAVPFPAPIAGLPAGRVEVAPADVETQVRLVLRQLLESAPDAESLFCAGQMGGVILVDETGAALTNYLSWRDQRTQEPQADGTSCLDSIRTRWSSGELADLGHELQAGSTSSLLFWLSQRDQLPRRALPATIADFVLGRLCGIPPWMHPTQAIGLLNLHTHDWHRDAFAVLGLGGVRWPEIAETMSPFGTMNIGGRRLACYASLGDQPCALLGVGLQRQELSLNISTGSQVTRRVAAFQPGPYQSRYYFHGDFLNTITHLPAGRSLNVLYGLITELAREWDIDAANPWEFIAQSAAAADGGGLSVDLAFFAGPLGSRGAIEGITTENFTVGNLFRAALQSMAHNYALCAERLCPDHAELTPVVSGGLTRSLPILRELIQERFARPLRESAATEETLLGLLDVARQATGAASV